jgi:LPXTG-motif cell wall-anchored protein
VKRIIHLILILFLSTITVAQQASLQAGVDQTQVAVGEQFTLRFEANGRMQGFQLPDLSKFRVLSGPNQSTQQSWINGKSSMSVTYSYVLSAREAGSLTIGPATATVSGKKVRSNPIEMKVTKERERSNNPNDPYNIAQNNVIIRPVISKRKVYVGEAVTLTYKLYYTLDIQAPSIDPPSLTGFYTEDLDLGRITSNQRENLNGKLYNVAVLKKYVLIPQRSGSFDLDPLEMEMEVGIPSNQRDFFGRPVNKYIHYTARSQAVHIDVEYLPQSGQPVNFSGAVGEMRLDVSLDPQEVEANSSVNLKIEVGGRGNMKLFELPEADIPTSIEVYDPKLSDQLTVGTSGHQGKRSAEYLLVPRYGGSYKIPAIEFSYFDLKSKTYKTLTAGPFELKVEGETASGKEGNAGGVVSPGSKEDIRYLEQDILFIKTEAFGFDKAGRAFSGSSIFYTLMGIPPLLLLLVLLFARRRNKELQDVKGVRSRKAGAVARKRLSAARKLRDESRNKEFFEQIQKTLIDYVMDKSKLDQTQIDRKGLKTVLSEHGVVDELAEAMVALFDECGFARYAPGGVAQKLEDTYSAAEELIAKIEAEWK